MSNAQRDLEKENFWRGALARQADSGLPVRAFCRQEQLTESAFYAWRRTLAERDGRPLAPSFVPAIVKQEQSQDAIVVELTSGSTLRLPPSMPTDRVADLVHALELRGKA